MKSDSSCSSNTPDRDFNYTPADASEKAVAKGTSMVTWWYQRMLVLPFGACSVPHGFISSNPANHFHSYSTGGVACPFPWRLHEMLKVASEEGLEHIVSWAPHGKAFTVHKPVEFAEQVMKRFFCQTKFASFQRQLNLYGFARFCHGLDKGAYYHSCFIRGQRGLVRQMVRRKIKGQAAILRRPLPTEEPDFYSGQPAVHYEGLHNEISEHQQHAVSPIPSRVLVQQHNSNAEQPMPVPTYDESSDDFNLDLFDGPPFSFVTDEQPTVPPMTPASRFDPATELAKLRAQIRRKKAEYDQITSSRRSSATDSLDGLYLEEQPRRQVSTESHNLVATPLEPRKLVAAPGGAGSYISVYKGSYISV